MAYKPAAAKIPDCRIPPPTDFRILRHLQKNKDLDEQKANLIIVLLIKRQSLSKLLILSNLAIKSFFPTTTEPTGAPSPLLKHTDTESHGSTKDDAGTPS